MNMRQNEIPVEVASAISHIMAEFTVTLAITIIIGLLVGMFTTINPYFFSIGFFIAQFGFRCFDNNMRRHVKTIKYWLTHDTTDGFPDEIYSSEREKGSHVVMNAIRKKTLKDKKTKSLLDD